MPHPTVGEPAPPFTLDGDAGPVSLADFAGKWVVLFFYPKDNTPGCTLEAQQFRDLYPEFLARGAEVLGVSADSVRSHQGFRDRQGLTFPLLSDPGKATLQAYGAFGIKKMYGKEVQGIVRSTVLVDPHGNVARVWPKVTVDGHARKVLEAIPG
ncbi:peroxiredoxin [Myxococcota bacterium]|nr:peroxiredoxin [Myxococcota bacterium]